MKKKQNRFDFESDERRLKCLNDVRVFFLEERDEEIGLIEAEQIADFFFDLLGEEVYEKALVDVHRVVREKFEDLDVEINALAGK